MGINSTIHRHDAAPAPGRNKRLREPGGTNAVVHKIQKGMVVCDYFLSCAVVRFKVRCNSLQVVRQLAELKCMESTGGKEARKNVQGIECPHCQKFYNALESWGTFDSIPVCGHIREGATHC